MLKNRKGHKDVTIRLRIKLNYVLSLAFKNDLAFWL